MIIILFSVLNPEERARIYSSDSDEGSDDDKAQRLMKAKKLDSDEVGAVTCRTDRGQCEVGCQRLKSQLFSSPSSELNRTEGSNHLKAYMFTVVLIVP